MFAGGGGGGGGGRAPPPPDPPMEFAKLNIADITGTGKISYFSYLCTSTVIRQGCPPPWKNFLDPRLQRIGEVCGIGGLCTYIAQNTRTLKSILYELPQRLKVL